VDFSVWISDLIYHLYSISQNFSKRPQRWFMMPNVSGERRGVPRPSQPDG
jgi:hypothetical protein